MKTSSQKFSKRCQSYLGEAEFPESWALLFCWLSGETRWMLRPHFHALSISLAINATCKHLKGSQDSPGALSSVNSISGKNQILLWWQPAGINHTFIGEWDGGMSGFPERPNSTRVETETVISHKRRGVCRHCLKAFGIFGDLSSVCVVPWVWFSSTDLHRSRSLQNSLWREIFHMYPRNDARCRSKNCFKSKAKDAVDNVSSLSSCLSWEDIFTCSTSKTDSAWKKTDNRNKCKLKTRVKQC